MPRIPQILSSLNPFASKADVSTAEPANTNNAATTSPTRTVRPPHSPIEDRRTSVAVDLTSPTISARPLAQQAPLPDANPRPLKRLCVSPEERRLVPDHRVPADAIPVPNPQSYFHQKFGALAGSKMPKPTSNNSFRPMNTIDSVNPRHGQRNPQTYSNKPQQSTTPMGNGQIAFTNFYDRSTLQKDDERPRDGHTQRSVKRRKTESSHEVISLVDDDEARDARTLTRLEANTPSRVQPSRASWSQKIMDGGSTALSGSKALAAPCSAFQSVESMVDPSRKKARNPVANGVKSQRTSPGDLFRSERVVSSMSAHGSPIRIHDDEPLEPTENARRKILEDFSQGITNSPPGPLRPNSKDIATTSSHFPGPKINTSTSPPRAEIGRSARSDRVLSNLRDSFRRSRGQEETVDDDEDELHAGVPRSKLPPGRPRRTSLSKPSYAANSAAKMHQNRVPSRGWPLIYARTHGFEARDPEMYLKTACQEKSFRVASRDERGMIITKIELDLARVNHALADDTSRIRLQGSRGHGGNLYLFDLEFADTQDFKLFRDHYVAPIIRSGRVYVKEQAYMEILFEKGLETNEKVGKLPLVNDSKLSSPEEKATSRTRQGERVHKGSSILDQLKESAALDQTQSNQVNAKGNRNETGAAEDLQNATATRVRPVRTTRGNKPSYNIDVDDPPTIEKDVYKFSVIQGLGKAWSKPLQYGSGRRRALVEWLDMPKLDEGEFLNDSLIDFYLIYLFDQVKVPEGKVYFFNTHFYSSLTRHAPGQKANINYDAVARWTSKIDIFSYDYIVIPINENLHWYLAIICNVNNIARKPAIQNLDEDQKIEEAPKLKSDQVVEVEEGTPPDPPAAIATLVKPEEANTDIAAMPDDQVNLFDEEARLEESKLDIVDIDAMDHNEHVPRTMSGSGPDRASPVSETARLGKLTIEDSIPKGILADTQSSPAATKKAKRKAGPPPKKWDPDEPVIMILDSLGGNTRSKTVRALKDYIREEGKAKRGMDAVITQNGCYPKENQIPMQNNLSDCGVYLLGYVQKFFSDPDEFKARILSGQMSPDTDWPDMPMPEMRDKMRNILLGLGQQQETELEKEKAKRKAMRKSTLPAISTQSQPHSPAGAVTKAPEPTLMSPIQLQFPMRVEVRSVSPPKHVMKVDDSPPPMPVTISPNRRKVSPQVVIPRGSPQAQRSPKRPPQHSNIVKPSPSREVDEFDERSRSDSPTKRRKVEPNDELSSPESRRSRASPRRTRQSPKGYGAVAGSGSSHHPIMLEDSQESPDSFRASGPRTLNFQSSMRDRRASPMTSDINRQSSMQKRLKSPRQNESLLRTHQHSSPFPGNDLIESLENTDTAGVGSGASSHSHAVAKKGYEATEEQDEEEDFERFSDDLEEQTGQDGSVTVDDEVNDTIVGETPPHKRSSPPIEPITEVA